MTEPRDYDEIITITIDNKKPVELGEFALALLSLQTEYRDFVRIKHNLKYDSDIILYIQVREGSLTCDIFKRVTQITFDFVKGKLLKDFYDHIRNAISATPEEKDLTNISDKTLKIPVILSDPLRMTLMPV